MSCSIFHAYLLFGLLSSWLVAHLRRGNITLYFPSCCAHSVSGSNQSRLMNIRRLCDVVTLKEKERNFCVVAHRGSAR